MDLPFHINLKGHSHTTNPTISNLKLRKGLFHATTLRWTIYRQLIATHLKFGRPEPRTRIINMLLST